MKKIAINKNGSVNEQVLEKTSNFLAEEKKEKRQLDICPYCGGKMELRFKTDEDYPKSYGRYGHYNYSRGRFGIDAYMYCNWCTARSPEFVIKPWMINMDMVLENLNKIIDDTIEDCLSEKEEESDDE